MGEVTGLSSPAMTTYERPAGCSRFRRRRYFQFRAGIDSLFLESMFHEHKISKDEGAEPVVPHHLGACRREEDLVARLWIT